MVDDSAFSAGSVIQFTDARSTLAGFDGPRLLKGFACHRTAVLLDPNKSRARSATALCRLLGWRERVAEDGVSHFAVTWSLIAWQTALVHSWQMLPGLRAWTRIGGKLVQDAGI